MPLSASFAADFNSFYAACIKAEVHLKSFETGAKGVGTALDKAVDGFSGRKIMQEAAIAERAVLEVGGAAKLTEAEAAKVNRTVTEALAKFKALGLDAPPGLVKIANETKQADKASTDLLGSVKSLAIGFAAMFSARAAFNFVKSSLDEAGALKDLSQQTRINVEDLQALAGSMSEFGVDADTLGNALYGLSRKVAGDDESVAVGLHTMGMTLEELKGINGEELFLKIEGGLAKLQGGLRDDTAAKLFGSKLGMAMAGASEGIEDTYAKTKRLGNFMKTDAVNAADEFGESIARAERSLSALAVNVAGPVAEGFNVLFGMWEKGASKGSIFWAMLKDWNNTFVTGSQQTSNLTKLLDDLNRKTDANTKSTGENKVGLDARTDAQKAAGTATAFLAALEADAAKAVTATQKTQLLRLKELGALNAENAAILGVSAGAYARYTVEVAKATEAHEKMIEKIQKADLALVESVANLQTTLGALSTQSTKQLEKDVTQLHLIEAMIKRLDAELRPLVITAEDVLAKEQELLESGRLKGMVSGDTAAQKQDDLIESYERAQGAIGNRPFTKYDPANNSLATGSSLLRPQSLVTDQPTITNYITMSGLLATTDPSGKKALADAVNAAVTAQLQQVRKLN